MWEKKSALRSPENILDRDPQKNPKKNKRFLVYIPQEKLVSFFQVHFPFVFRSFFKNV